MTRRRRRPGQVVAILGLVGLALASAACSSGEEVALDGDPADMLRRAVAETDGTLRLRVHATTDAQLFLATEVAEGIVEPDGDSRVTITRSFEFPEGQDTGGLASSLEALAGTTEVVTVGDVTYRTLPEDGPSARRPTLPPGVEWVADRGGPATSVADLRGYLATRGIVDLLGGVAAVEDAGPTEVDGVQVRWLKATAPDTGDLADVVGSATTIDVAVAGGGEIRRIAFAPAGEEGFRTQVIVDVRESDVDETVEAPSADVTIDRSELDASEQPTP